MLSSAVPAGSVADTVARLERLPLSAPIVRIVLLLAFGCFFENYFLQMTAYVVPGMMKSGIFHLGGKSFFGADTVGSFIMAGFAGMAVGSALFGMLADRFGRKPMFAWAMVWYSATTALMAFQSDALAINLWRFLSSIGLGLELVVVNTFVSELVATRYRGRAVALYQVLALSAVPLSALLALRLTSISVMGIEGWRGVELIGVVGVCVIWWFRRRLPESPRWLAHMGRAEEADAVLSTLEAAIERRSGRALPPPVHQPVAAKEPAAAFRTLFVPPYLRRTVMFVIQQMFMPIAYYGFASWVPTLLIAKGIHVTDSLFYAFLIAFAQPLSPLVMFAFADRVDRKWQIVLGGIASAAFMTAFALGTAPWLIVLFGLGVTFSKTVITTAIAGYMPEVYPTRVRGRGHGLAYGVSRIMAAFSGPIIGFVLARQGVGAVATLIGGSFLALSLVTFLLGPRVHGRSLEDINA